MLWLSLAAMFGCSGDKDDSGEPPPPPPPTTVTTGDTGPSGPTGPIDPTLVSEPIGDPAFAVSSAVVFSAPLGEPLPCVLEPEHTFGASAELWLPGDPHQPPYGPEIETKLLGCGYVNDGYYAPEEIADPLSAWLILVVEPGPLAPQGFTPDFQAGPILPHDIFPMVIDADVYRDDVLVGIMIRQDMVFPPLDFFALAGEGYSHLVVPYFLELDNLPGGATVEGEFEFRVLLLDANQDGWSVSVGFEVR